MRVIKFRGKVDGVWWHVSPDDNPGLFGSFWYVVDRETVGQYVGDAENGQAIYEDDIIKHEPHWHDGATITLVKGLHLFCGDYGTYQDVKVIGNLHDTPELQQKAGNA